MVAGEERLGQRETKLEDRTGELLKTTKRLKTARCTELRAQGLEKAVGSVRGFVFRERLRARRSALRWVKRERL